MTDVADRLARELHAAIASRLDGTLTAANSTRLLFAALGRPVDPLQFALPTAAATLEATSAFVDCLPSPGTMFIPDVGTLSDAYDGLLSVARPRPGLPEDVRETVAAQLAAARKRFDNSRIGRISVPVPYVPTLQDPMRWYDPAGLHWTRLSVSEEQSSGQPDSDPLPIKDSPPPWQFRTPDEAQSLNQWVQALPTRANVELSHPQVELLTADNLQLMAFDRPATIVAPVLERHSVLEAQPVGNAAKRGRPRVDRAPRVAAADDAVLHAQPLDLQVLKGRPAVAESLRLLGRPEVMKVLVQESARVPTTSSSFSIELDYCLVSLRRNWLQRDWMESDEWHVPGYQPGEVSAGDPTVADQQLAGIPVAFVAVKDVVIRAQWSEQDGASLSRAAGLGPFGVAGGAFSAEAGTLVIAGVQLIACLCQVPPKLPPDPATP